MDRQRHGSCSLYRLLEYLVNVLPLQKLVAVGNICSPHAPRRTDLPFGFTGK